MQHDAGYPPNWLAEDRARAAAAGDRRGAGRRRRRRDEGAVRPQPADSAGRVRAGAADRLRQRREPAAGARGGAPRPDRRPAGHGRVAPADRDRGARRKRAARHRRRRWPGSSCRWPRRACCCRSPSPAPRMLPIDTTPSPLVLAFATGLALVTGLLFGAAPAWFATRTDPIEALRGAGRTAGDRSSFARKALLVVQATLSVVLVAGSTMLGRSLGNLEGQDFGFDRDGRVLVSVGRPSASITGERLTALYRDLEGRLERIPGVQSAGLALYNPLTNNWGEGVLIAGKPRAGPGRADRRVVGSRQHELPAGAGREAGARPPLHRRRQRDGGERGGGQRGVREALLQARRGSARSALRAQPARERQHLPHRRRRRRRQVRRRSSSIARCGRCSSCRWRRR